MNTPITNNEDFKRSWNIYNFYYLFRLCVAIDRTVIVIDNIKAVASIIFFNELMERHKLDEDERKNRMTFRTTLLI